MHVPTLRASVAALAAGAVTMACASDRESTAVSPSSPLVQSIEQKMRRFAPVDIEASLPEMPGHEPGTLAALIKAAQLMDGLYLDQVWAGNPSLLAALAADRTPEGQAQLHYFLINKGPWSRLDHDEAFVKPEYRVPDKPEQANFYPADATREEVEQWFASLSGEARTQATGFFSLIRRDAAGRLMAVPYSVAYRNTLLRAAEFLRQAADNTREASLKQYLQLRADAFLSNDYYASDVAWMELDAVIEPTIGPYETYEDGWFGYKAAFEAFVTIRDDAETKRLSVYSSRLQGLENALPIDPKFRNPSLGALAPIRVVNVVFTAGDANRGVQTAAFNLPNDDRVVREKGAKRVMLKNVQEAKFSKVLQPIAAVAVSAADRGKVSFDAFFTHILMHELMHGLGPHQVHGTTGAVRIALKDTYSALEEAKADISGLWALQKLADDGVIAPAIAQAMYSTFLASTFRSIRFGLNEAHGKGIAIQLNYLLDQGAFAVGADGTFAVVEGKIRDAVASLTRDIMTLQATGDYAAAQELLKKYVVIRPEVQRVLDKLADVPVDIEPNFVTAKAMLGR